MYVEIKTEKAQALNPTEYAIFNRTSDQALVECKRTSKAMRPSVLKAFYRKLAVGGGTTTRSISKLVAAAIELDDNASLNSPINR